METIPVVVGTRLFLSASEGDRLLTICLDTRTGRELWRRPVRREQSHKIFRANDPASPTPAADESGVVVFFPDFGLVSYTPDGKERWTYRLGPFRNFYGMASSPVVAGDLVVLVCDQQAGSFAIALDHATGRERWKTDRPGMTVGWATPMVFRPAKGPAELIVLGSTRLDSYYLATGERRWWLPVGSSGALGTPVANGDTLMVSTLSTTEPWMPAFEAALQTYDKDHDGRLSWEEFRGDPDLGEHFGWIDANADKFVDAPEWNAARAIGMGEYGAVAIRPRGRAGPTGDERDPLAISKESSLHPRPAVLPERVLPGAGWWHYYVARPGHRSTAEGGSEPRGAGRVLRVTHRCRRQGLSRQRRGQDDRPEGRGGLGSAGGKRSRR